MNSYLTIGAVALIIVAIALWVWGQQEDKKDKKKGDQYKMIAYGVLGLGVVVLAIDFFMKSSGNSSAVYYF